MLISAPKNSPRFIQVVLFILDQNDNSSLCVPAFQEKGFTTVCEKPENALQTCRVVDPALNVVDVNLTHKNRLAFCSSLRSIASGPILLLVPNYDSIKINEMYEIGVDECLLKPVSPAFLMIKAVSWLLRKRWLGQDANLAHVYTHI